MKGIEGSFEECFDTAQIMEIDSIEIPVLHIQLLIDNKKAVARPKDPLDVENLVEIKKLQQKNNGSEE